MIELRKVSHSYGDRAVLRSVSLRLTERRIGVIGANGSGKSTLARLINGLVQPDTGQVRVAGLDPVREPREVRRRVGFVFPDADAQIIMPTVAEDVAAGLPDRTSDTAQRRVTEVLNRYGLGDHADHPAHLLSGGQKQLLALASVLVTEPDILVCDEPTTLLDLRNVTLLRRTLDELDQRVILLTHHLETLRDFDRVLVMDEGRVVFDGAPEAATSYYRELMATPW
ncbi:ABC transporter ATP-binding protein [Lipingzhangella sp. LS1_29]|uniref:ABC transporter ATP-binding protein n=1 Tax=Lipingzhangella rawalii TaxID=2055835 RepID=A0ABU2HBL5_9ACTN|nr:ABC transporter ATP-binding protein [Lipingzhangella rawalii]MDS1271984.1 ABC transporter ATP-binding protein [Lipingzhangella rawalii]